MSSIAPEVWKDHIAADIEYAGFEHGSVRLPLIN